ncbi:MAG: tetratricopeptide repeat protein [Ignavibacteriaceae bacterium]|nr:tetratricopeptide repeat protein [Ignavibacteriaceae bacterium]
MSLNKELVGILSQYFDKNEIAKFYHNIFDSVKLEDKTEIKLNKIDESQLSAKIPIGIKEREVINHLTTFAEQKLTKESFLALLLELAHLTTFSGEVSIATELSQDVIAKCESDDKLLKYLAEAHLSLARIAWSQAYWDQSQKEVSTSYKIYSKLKDKEGFAKCENMLATIYGEQGDIQKSLTHLETGLAFLADSDNISLRAMFEVNLGILYNISGDNGKAIWNYKNALQKYEKLNDARRIARVRHNIGMLFTKMGEYQSALEEFNQSISISLENGYLSNCAIGYIGKAFIYTKLKNSALAEVFTDKAMEISYKINDTLSIADIYKIKGMIQGDLENFDLSEELFENSIRLNDDFNSKLNKAESEDELNILYNKIDDKEVR